MSSIKVLFLILLTAITALNVFALEGKVISIADGDTLTVLTADQNQIKVRLSGIDCPESNQAYGQKAKQVLSSKKYRWTVILKNTSKDQ